MRSKRDVGRVLVGVAVLLAVAAVGWWQWESHRTDQRQEREDAMAIFMERPADEISANRAGPIAVGAVSAVLLVSGVILVASDD